MLTSSTPLSTASPSKPSSPVFLEEAFPWAPAADWKTVAIGRFVLAAAGLIVVWIVPAESPLRVSLTYVALVLHTLYAAAVYLLLRFRSRLAPLVDGYAHVSDVRVPVPPICRHA